MASNAMNQTAKNWQYITTQCIAKTILDWDSSIAKSQQNARFMLRHENCSLIVIIFDAVAISLNCQNTAQKNCV
jgi:hypothetical protein